MRVLITGDAHGHEGIVEAAKLAQRLDVGAVIICGDIWAIDYNIDGVSSVPVHIIPGNHEDWLKWHRENYGRGIIGHKNYTRFDIDGRVFGVIGRIDDVPAVHELQELGVDFGDPEQIFFRRYEGQKVRELLGGIDVLLTHDAPFPFILGHRPLSSTPDYVGAPQLKTTEVVGSPYLNEVIRTTKPKFAYHGHMHLLNVRYIGTTLVYGLPPIDKSFNSRGYAILDTDTMRSQYFDLYDDNGPYSAYIV